MHILFTYGLVGRGGDAVQVLEMVEALRNLGHTVRLVGPEPLRPYEFGTGTSRVRAVLRRLPWWAKDLIELGLNLRTLQRAKRTLLRGELDLAFHRAGIYDFVGPRLARRVSLIAYLDAPFPLERAFRGEGHLKWLHRRAMRALGQSAHLIVTVSAASELYYTGLGVPPNKVLVLPNGVSAGLCRQGLRFAQQHPPFSQGPPWTVGFVGSLSRWHRMDLLLEALHILDAERPGTFQLEVVGFGEDYAKLRALEKRLGLEGRVTWVGAVPHREAFERISHFDVAVLPHTLTTGAPIKLFEYAAVARPTVAPSLPNLRALFSEEEMCFVRPEDPQALTEAVLRLAGDPERARTMGLKAQARVHGEYTWEKIVQQIVDAAVP